MRWCGWIGSAEVVDRVAIVFAALCYNLLANAILGVPSLYTWWWCDWIGSAEVVDRLAIEKL